MVPIKSNRWRSPHSQAACWKRFQSSFQFQIKRSHLLVDLLTPVHPWVSSLLPPLKLASIWRLSCQNTTCSSRGGPPSPKPGSPRSSTCQHHLVNFLNSAVWVKDIYLAVSQPAHLEPASSRPVIVTEQNLEDCDVWGSQPGWAGGNVLWLKWVQTSRCGNCSASKAWRWTWICSYEFKMDKICQFVNFFLEVKLVISPI